MVSRRGVNTVPLKKNETIEAHQHASGSLLRDVLESISSGISLPAGKTGLMLLEIDPHRAHAYWNIEPVLMGSGRSLTLRVYDVTTSGHADQPDQVYDVEVNGSQGRWYLDFWRDARTFLADIGYPEPDGTFTCLARSNEITTPPANPMPDALIVEHTDPNGQILQTQLPVTIPPPPEAEPQTAVEVIEPVQLLDPDFPVAQWIENALGQTAQVNNPSMIAGETAVAFEEVEEEAADEFTALHFPGPDELAASLVENRAAVQAFYDAVEALAPSLPVLEPAQSQFSQTDAAEPEPAEMTSSAIGPMMGISSLERPAREDDLEVHVELHIYGKTRPHRELTLYGEKVVAGPDGTFSIRRQLPDGSMTLPFE